MYIHSIKLINIRSFSNLELELSKSINLLVGHNNSGKSTIIKSLNKLQNAQALGIDDIRKSYTEGRIYLDIENISAKDKQTFILAKKDEIIKMPDSDRLKVMFGMYNSPFEQRKITDAYVIDLNLPYVFDQKGKLILSDQIKADEELRIFHSLPNLESANNFIFPFFAKRKSNYYENQNGSSQSDVVAEDLRNITAKMQNISNASHPMNKLFEQWVNDILGFSIGVIPAENNYHTTGIFVSNTTHISIGSMGEGVVNILGLIIMLLTENGKLYLIEELENDIHPKALKKLLQLILEKAGDNQFIISTHSNIVLKYLGVQNSKIFHLQWKPYEKSAMDRLPTTTVSELGKGPKEKLELLEELGYDLFDFDLHRSYLFFEESSAETLFKKFLIPTFFPELIDRVGTIAASGAGNLKARFRDFLRLFVFVHTTPVYNSRAWVIADGDRAGLDSIEGLKRDFPSWDPSHFISLSKGRIEDFFPERFQQDFQIVSEISDKKKRQYAKIEFNRMVIDWTKSDPQTAKAEFAVSAGELLGHLQQITSSLAKNLKT